MLFSSRMSILSWIADGLTILTRHPKAGTAKSKETSIARQLLGKHVSATTPYSGIIVETVFSVGPPRSYIKRISGS
jgi:hypothetical protein